MKNTYKAVEVSAPGVLRVVERQVSEPGAGQVRIRVEACGICLTDAATVMGIYPGLTLPRVPLHVRERAAESDRGRFPSQWPHRYDRFRMLPPESGPDPLRARRLAVPLLEARRALRLPLLCMCFSFVCTSLLYFTLSERQARRCHIDAALNLFLFPSIR